MLSTQLINHVHLVLVVVLQKVPNLLNVITVLEGEKLELIKDFLQFNKHVLSAAAMVKRSVNHASTCSGNGKVQANENVTVKVPKGVDDGTRIRVSGKGRSRI